MTDEDLLENIYKKLNNCRSDKLSYPVGKLYNGDDIKMFNTIVFLQEALENNGYFTQLRLSKFISFEFFFNPKIYLHISKKPFEEKNK